MLGLTSLRAPFCHFNSSPEVIRRMTMDVRFR